MRFKIDDSEMLKQIKQEAIDSEAQGEERKGDEGHTADQEKVKNKLAFRNISDSLIEIIENAPVIDSEGNTHSQHVISGSTQVESLIFREEHQAEGASINSKVFGYLMAWNALLIKIENGRIKSQLQNQTDYA